MTELEAYQNAAILLCREYLSAGVSPKKVNYMDLMEMIRKSIKKYENKFFGCATGLHSMACTCKPAKLGVVKPDHFHER
jgi:hypothetical protein